MEKFKILHKLFKISGTKEKNKKSLKNNNCLCKRKLKKLQIKKKRNLNTLNT